MIRTTAKILGEANDPNTVVATETLSAGKIIVGAGNHGIKTVELGNKRLLYTNENGEVSGFDYNVADKRVCTDASGNLVLKDIPVFRPITVSSAAFGPSGTQCNVYRATGDAFNAIPLEKFRGWMQNTGYASLIKIDKASEVMTGQLLLLLSPGIHVTSNNQLYISLTIEIEDAVVNEESLAIRRQNGISLGTPDGTVHSIFGASADSEECIRTEISFTNKVSVPAGNYSTLLFLVTIPALSAESDSVYVKVSGCCISGV